MKGYRDTRLLEMLDYIDPKYIEKTKKYYKSVPARGAHNAKIDPKKQIKYIVALVAAVLLLSAFIPAVTYIIRNHLILPGFHETTGDETTLTPDITSEDITTSPETTETEPEQETTESLYDGTTAEPEPEYDGSRGLEYEISADGKYAILSGIGTCTDKDIVVASSYMGYPVKYIGWSAFEKNADIRSVVIPEGIETIGQSAFRECSALVSVTLPDSVKSIGKLAFAYCSSLTDIKLPSSLELMDESTFAYCGALKSIDIPESVTHIKKSVFEGCSGISDLYIPKNVTYIDVSNFRDVGKFTIDPENPKYSSAGNCFIDKETKTLLKMYENSVLPDDGSIEIIGETAIDEYLPIKELILPEGVRYICEGSLTAMEMLEYLHLPSTFAEYEQNSFSHFLSLKKITIAEGNPKYYVKGNCLIERASGTVILGTAESVIPSDGSVKHIGAAAFAANKKLKSIVIPEGVVSVQVNAFAGCSALNKVTFPKSLERIGACAFRRCDSLKSIELGDNVKYIEAEAFSVCTGLTEIILPKQITSIGHSAFSGCENLESVILPEGVDEIDRTLFGSCSGLVSLRIPKSVTKIEKGVFADCKKLSDLVYSGTVREWNGMQKESGWNEGCPFTVVHCTDGDVSLLEYDGSRGLEYQIEGDHAVLVGIGTCTDKEIIVASTYKGLPVTAIGRRAIYGVEGVTRVVISDTVTHLDFMAISHCYDLGSIHIPANLTVMEESAIISFGNIRSITVDPKNPRYYSINNCLIDRETKTLLLGCDTSIIPTDGSIGIIAPCAFTMSKGIESITIPEGVTKIGRDAFYKCSSLRSVELPESLITIESSVFSNCPSLEKVKLGGKVEYMGDYAFSECEKLGEIILPDSLGFLGNYAFQGCTALKRAVLSKNLETLDLMAFTSCKNLESVIIPEGVKNIGTDTFSDTALKEIIIPASVETIERDAFGYCESLMSVSFAGTVSEWIAVEKDVGWHTVGTFKVISCADGDVKLYSDSEDGGSIGLEYEINADGKSVRLIGEGICTDEKIVIASKFHGIPVTEIDFVALSSCSFIEEIVIPESVTVIRSGAFGYCNNLKKVTLPSALEYISDLVFADCESLESIVIPRKVKRVDTWAFRDCKKLTDFAFAGTVAEWHAIEKGKGNDWNEDCPFTVVHCSDGDATP